MTKATIHQPKPIEQERIPPLQTGDRLSRDEFERRYDAMPGLKKAELIEGVVYVPAPTSHRYHGNPHFNVIGWLGHYVAATPGVQGGDSGTLRLDLKNEPRPDAYLIVLPNHGGQVRIDAAGFILGAPELVAEVGASSANYDLHDKLNAYRRNGVQEYVVWRVFDAAIDWFILREDRYEPLGLDTSGIYKSQVLPGLWLDPALLIGADLQGVAEVSRRGIESDEHAQFAKRLQANAGHAAP
jgi:hypothetical protein